MELRYMRDVKSENRYGSMRRLQGRRILFTRMPARVSETTGPTSKAVDPELSFQRLGRSQEALQNLAISDEKTGKKGTSGPLVPHQEPRNFGYIAICTSPTLQS